MSINAMRERRNAIAKECKNLLEKMGEKPSADDVKLYDAKIEEITQIDASIAREQRLLDLTAEQKFTDMGVKEGDLPAMAKASEGRRLFDKLVRNGKESLSSEEWLTLRNTMSTTTGSEGGFTVQTDVAKQLVEALKEYGGMRDAAEVLTTAQGNPMNYPTTDGTAELGEIVAENAAATSQDAAFGTVSLNVFKYGSKVITVPIELLQDSTVDIEGLIRARVVERIGRITNAHFTTGTGTGQPRGIVTAATVGKIGTTGQVATVIYDDLVDVQHSVDPAYRRGNRGSWMFNDGTLRSIRKIKDTQGRPIFNPGYEVGTPGGAPDTLLGSPIIVNQEMPEMAASAKAILFGDFRYYKIRDAMNIQLFRFADSPFIRNGQIGFLAWMRSGGNFIDASGGAVKAYQNAAT